MKNTSPFTYKTLKAIIALLLVFIIDLFIPLGVAIGVLYILCLFLVSAENKKTIITFALITTALTIFKFIVFQNPDTNYIPYLNRSITVVVLWIITILSIRHRDLIEKNETEHKMYTKEIEQLLFMTNHKIRQPVVNCMGLLDVIDHHNPSKEEMIKICEHLKKTAHNLNDFSIELNNTLAEMTAKHKSWDI
jgi:hypothetical protein